MLKRFMNWLLHRIQRFLSIFNSQTKKPYSEPLPLDGAPPEASRAEPNKAGRNADGNTGRNAESRYTQSDTAAGPADLEPSPFVESQQPSSSSSPLTETPRVDPALVEPDTYRRLNASTAAKPGVADAVPSLPTDVSDLINTSQVAKPAVIEEQLPKIHDLLPAIEESDTEELATEDLVKEEAATEEISIEEVATEEIAGKKLSTESEVVSKAISSDLKTTDDSAAAISGPVDSDAVDSDAVDSDAISSETVEPAPPVEQQAVLCSFDIIESGDEPTPIEHTPVPEEAEETSSLIKEPQVSDTIDANESQSSESQSNEAQFSASDVEERSTNTAEVSTNSNGDNNSSISSASVGSVIDELERTESLQSTAEYEEQASPSNDSSKADQVAEQSSASNIRERDREANTESPVSAVDSLPYPWSISVPKQAESSAPNELEENKKEENKDQKEAQSLQKQSPEEKGSEEKSLEEKSLEGQNQKEWDREPETRTEIFTSDSAEEDSSTHKATLETSQETSHPSEDNQPSIVTKKGVIKLLFTLKPGNFHGYIAPNDGTQDILFHRKYIDSEVFDTLDRGSHVSVDVKHIEGKAYATKVILL